MHDSSTPLDRDAEVALLQTLGIPATIKQVMVADHEINYLIAGEGPTLLLIHGANFGWGVWYPNIPELAKSHRVVAIDLPGAGRSTRVDYRTLEPMHMLTILEQFVMELELTSFAVVGCSLGAWLAVRLALNMPKRVTHLVIENASGFTPRIRASDKMIALYPFAHFITRTMLRPDRHNPRIESFLRGIFADRDLKLRNEFIDYFYETMRTSHNLLFISRLNALAQSFYLDKMIEAITQPTLVIWGKEDQIMSLAWNEENLRRIPDVQVIVYDGIGHIPSLELASRFNSDVRSFLKERSLSPTP